MNRSSIPTLAELLEHYYRFEELEELAGLFDVEWDQNFIYRNGIVSWLGVSRQLVERLDHGSHRVLMEAVLEQIDSRNFNSLAGTQWEQRVAHENLTPKIAKVRQGFATDAGIPHEITTPEDRPYTAKAEVREFIEQAATEILLVDPYVGVGTLDCLRSARVPLRILTGSRPNSIENGFSNSLAGFQAEGYKLTVRQHDRLHDRHFAFNDRCWLVGSSLKDAGKKAFHIMEIVDSRTEIVAALESKWASGTPYP
jgi:hypothetical protein